LVGLVEVYGWSVPLGEDECNGRGPGPREPVRRLKERRSGRNLRWLSPSPSGSLIPSHRIKGWPNRLLETPKDFREQTRRVQPPTERASFPALSLQSV
jgi:hypothetical protein